jgi:hypothetical protein
MTASEVFVLEDQNIGAGQCLGYFGAVNFYDRAAETEFKPGLMILRRLVAATEMLREPPHQYALQGRLRSEFSLLH